MRVRWKALIPLLGVIGSWIASPEVLKLVPDDWSHWMLLISSLIAVVTPALLTNREPSPKMTKKKTTTTKTHKLPDIDRQ